MRCDTDTDRLLVDLEQWQPALLLCGFHPCVNRRLGLSLAQGSSMRSGWVPVLWTPDESSCFEVCARVHERQSTFPFLPFLLKAVWRVRSSSRAGSGRWTVDSGHAAQETNQPSYLYILRSPRPDGWRCQPVLVSPSRILCLHRTYQTVQHRPLEPVIDI